jgi:hypothetical protein
MTDVFDDTWDQISNSAITAVMIMMFMAVMMPSFINMFQSRVSNSASCSQGLAAQSFQGNLDPRDLQVTSQYQALDLVNNAPNAAWATAYFFNYGPGVVYVAVNKNRPYKLLKAGESMNVDFTNATNRIGFIEAYSATGQTAALSILGKF